MGRTLRHLRYNVRVRTYLAVAILVCGCSSNGGGGPAPRAYTDQAGRHCTTTGAAPSTCDQTPAPSSACTVDYPTPCWDVFPSSGVVENCAACCTETGSASSASPSDCTPIVCETAADCPFDFDVCTGGVCTAN